MQKRAVDIQLEAMSPGCGSVGELSSVTQFYPELFSIILKTAMP